MNDYFKNFKGCDHLGEISKNMCHKIHAKMVELKKQNDEINSLVEQHNPSLYLDNPKNCYDLPNKEMKKCLEHHRYMQKILEDKNNNNAQHDINKTLKKNDLVQLMNGELKNIVASKCKESLKDKQKCSDNIIIKCKRDNHGIFTSNLCKKIENIFEFEPYWVFDEYNIITGVWHYHRESELYFDCREINRI